MKCNICGVSTGLVTSRQIHLELRPTEHFCVNCYVELLLLYDKLIERMRGKRKR